MKLKSLYQLEDELARLLYDILPQPKYIQAMRLLKEIISWKEVELDESQNH